MSFLHYYRPVSGYRFILFAVGSLWYNLIGSIAHFNKDNKVMMRFYRAVILLRYDPKAVDSLDLHKGRMYDYRQLPLLLSLVSGNMLTNFEETGTWNQWFIDQGFLPSHNSLSWFVSVFSSKTKFLWFSANTLCRSFLSLRFMKNYNYYNCLTTFIKWT